MNTKRDIRRGEGNDHRVQIAVIVFPSSCEGFLGVKGSLHVTEAHPNHP